MTRRYVRVAVVLVALLAGCGQSGRRPPRTKPEGGAASRMVMVFSSRERNYIATSSPDGVSQKARQYLREQVACDLVPTDVVVDLRKGHSGFESAFAERSGLRAWVVCSNTFGEPTSLRVGKTRPGANPSTAGRAAAGTSVRLPNGKLVELESLEAEARSFLRKADPSQDWDGKFVVVRLGFSSDGRDPIGQVGYLESDHMRGTYVWLSPSGVAIRSATGEEPN